MQTPTHKIVIFINVTDQQLRDTDTLYEIIAPELKKDTEMLFKFNAFYTSKLAGDDLVDQFSKLLQPKIAKIASDLDTRLTLPLYAALARHISNEWIQEKVAQSIPAHTVAEALEAFKDVDTSGVSDMPGDPADSTDDKVDADFTEAPQAPDVQGWNYMAQAERVVGMSGSFSAPFTKPLDGLHTTVDTLVSQAEKKVQTAIEEAEKFGQDPYLAVISARSDEVSLEPQGTPTQTGTMLVVTGLSQDGGNVSMKLSDLQAEALNVGQDAQDFHPDTYTPPAPTTHAELPPGFKEHQGKRPPQDRSKPILTSRVLRGFEALTMKLNTQEHGHSETIPELTHGDRDVRTALMYIDRLQKWGRDKKKI